MRLRLLAHPGLVSVIAGAFFALALFIAGGADLGPVNLGLAALLGATFAGAMYRRMRGGRPPPD